MITSLLRVVAALFALTFIVAACAGDSGAEWTFSPVAVADEPTEPAEVTEPTEPTEAATEAPAEVTEPTEPTTASGEPRILELQADGALRFTDATGQQIQDIAVTPGETIKFQVSNTAGFAHNFYIGEDAELMVPAGTTDTGIPDWSTGVQELDWVVPDDITNLKFGCTVPGHYTLMQGTFSLSDTEPTEPTEAATEAPAEVTEPTEPTTASGEPRILELQADGALRFTDATGQQIQDIAVTPGETIKFQVSNTAGFAHNFYIGEDAELMVPAGTTDTGIPDWSTGVQELDWVVPDDITNLKFGCTVPGHYTLMQGTFSLSDTEPTEPTEAATEAPAEVTEPTEPTTASGEPRILELQADGALRFTDATGQQIQDIAVTPGETIKFQVSNTAGFAHNFYIGEDAELMVPAGTTDTGIPDWSTGVQELDWVVPDDITNLKFGCTVPGHYTLMQGTFSLSDTEPTEAATEVPAEVTEPTEPTEAAEGTAVEADARVIPIEADAALRFLQDGEQIRDIPVTPGEAVIFRIDNSAGFAHNFYIGEDAELMVPAGTTDTGIPDWDTGVQHLEWVVPDDITNLKFGCTVPGHYTLMQGTFSVRE